MFKKKNRYFVLFILFLVFLVAVVFVWYHGKGRNTINEGFQQTQNATALLKYGTLMLDLTNQKDFGSYDTVTNSPGWTIYWSSPPDKLPQAMIDSINTTYRQSQLMSKFDKEPDTFIRLDWLTHTPYTLDLKNYDPKKTCFKEYTINTGGATKKNTSGIYDVLIINATGQTLNSKRNQCNIQITPQYLSTLPWRIQQKYLDYILQEQQNLIRTKIQYADLNGQNCQDKRTIANSIFTKDMRNAYDMKRKQERDDAKKSVKTDLLKAADESLLDVANATQKSTTDILTNKTTRDTIKVLNAVKNLRASPFSAFSTAMELAGIDIQKEIIKTIVNVFRGKDPYAGLECPIGFEESSVINQDAKFLAISEIFPNPISDITNIIATKGSCTRYVKATGGQEAKTEMKEKFCDKAYIFPPERLVPLGSASATCEADRDINKKLQMASDWLTRVSIMDSATIFVYAIERFDYVANPNEYFMETAFQVRGYTKDPIPKVTYDTNNKLPTARTQGTVSSFTQKVKMRFYFNKNNCDYTILGFSGKAGDRLIFFQEWDESRTTDFVPTQSSLVVLYKYAILNNIGTPLDYVKQQEKSQELVIKISQEEADKNAKIEQERKELESLLQSLNPNQDSFFAVSLANLNLEGLQERQQLITKLNNPKWLEKFYTIKNLREEAAKLV